MLPLLVAEFGDHHEGMRTSPLHAERILIDNLVSRHHGRPTQHPERTNLPLRKFRGDVDSVAFSGSRASRFETPQTGHIQNSDPGDHLKPPRSKACEHNDF